MFKTKRFNVIHNPRAGVKNFVTWEGGTRVDGLPDFALPAEARAVMTAEEWKRRPILCPVRLPLDRFVSAVREIARDEAAAKALVGEDLTAFRSNPFATLFLVMQKKAEKELPRLLWPQARWLSCKVDVILPVHSFANFANNHPNGNSLHTRTAYGYQMPPGDRELPPKLREAVLAYYKEDVALFDTLPVWPHGTQFARSEVTLLSGNCSACADKALVSLVDPVADASPPPAPPPSRKARP